MRAKVQVRPSGHTFEVERGESVLDAALRQGISLPYGCRNGACGACKGRVVDGSVRYLEDPMALSEADEREGAALFCIAQPEGDLTIEMDEIEAAQEIAVRQLNARVERMERLASDVMRLWLRLPEGERLPFLAGQYVDFLLPDGRRRAFSLANPPHDDALLEFHIRRIPGGHFTEQLFNEMEEKTQLRIEGPRGRFFLRESEDRPALLLATGTGFGPVKAMLEHAIAEGSQRPFHLYWGARRREGLYLDTLVRQWVERHPNIHYTPVLSQPDGEWSGRTGHVQEVAAADFSDLTRFEAYACGHPQMVHAAQAALALKGLDPERCYSDAFEWSRA